MKKFLAPLVLWGLYLLAATDAHAGTFSTAPWTDDTTTGIVSGSTQWAHHFGSTSTATVDGVSVIGLPGPTASNANFSLVGTNLVFNGDPNDLSALTGTGSAIIANDFVYNGNPATVTVNGLTAGNTYTVSFLSVAFEGPGTRVVTISSGSDSRQVDQGEFGDDKGIRVDYTFTATAATRAINIAVNNVSGATFHLYGLTLRRESTPTLVTNTNDSGTGSLRWALTNAKDAPGGTAVAFAMALNGETITLSSEIIIDDPNLVNIDAGGLSAGVTIDGGPGTNRIFTLNAGGNLLLSNLRLTGGNGMGANQNGGGGAILNSGTMQLTGCTLSGNSTGGAGAIYSPAGTVLTLVQCTLSDNHASAASANGGAIVCNGALTLTQCTFSGNQTDSTVGGGGAIRINNPGTATITQCTFAGNSAPAGFGGALYHTGSQMTLTHCTLSGNSAKTGGAYFSTSSALTLTNSLIAGNTAALFYPDLISAVTPTTTGVNFIGDLDGSNLTAGPTILTGDPLLGELANNGGTTQTMALRAGSPALDAATVVGGLTGDQRGFARIRDGNGDGDGVPDIGAFEASCLIVTTAVDELDPFSPNGTGISLREALRDGVDLITFASGLTGPIVLGSEIIVSDTTRGVAVDATNRSTSMTIDGGPGANRLFTVNTNTSLTLRGLTLTGGNGGGVADDGHGGAIMNVGTLSLTDCTLSGNSVSGDGGAILSYTSLSLTHCTLSGNQAYNGGAIYIVSGGLALTQCKLSDNQAGAFGGAIYQGFSSVTLNQCSFAGNEAVEFGGVIYTFGGFLTFAQCTLTENEAKDGGAIMTFGITRLTHCTIASNHATDMGGGVLSYGSLTLQNSIVAGNTASNDTPDVATVTDPLGVNFIGDLTNSGLAAGPTVLTGDPLLAPLASNGGPTQTMAPKPGSLALDAVPAIHEVAGLTADQRGFPRKLDGDGTGGAAVDIGALELSRIIVTTTADELDIPSSNGAGISLREALRDVGIGGLITFAPGLSGQTILLGSQLEVASNVTIDASSLISGVTVSGNDLYRVFHVAPGIATKFLRLTITHATAGTGAYPNGYGGGLFVEGSLDLQECTITGNGASVGAGAFIAPTGSVTLNRSAVTYCFASIGGGIQNEGTLVCVNSTFAGCFAVQDGGAISAPFGKPVTLRHCTVSQNTANLNGGGVIGNAVTLENSVVSGNIAPSGANISGTPVLIGTSLTSGAPLLASLGNYGGPTVTLPPLPGSPALDQAQLLASTPTTDQRGQLRPRGLRPDIGAAEGPILVVTTAVDELDPPGVLGAGYSLREAARDVETGGTIAFDRAIFTGATPTTNTITLTKGPLNPQTQCTLHGSDNPGGITIRTQLSFIQQPQSQSVISGSAVHLFAEVAAIGGGVDYFWSFNYAVFRIGPFTSWDIPSVQEADEGVYDVLAVEAALPPGRLTLVSVTLSSPIVRSQAANLIVDGSPLSIKRQPLSAMLALGTNHTLSVVAAGPATPALTYQWKKNNVNIAGATKGSYTITNAQLAHAGAYTCLVKSGTVLPGVTSTTAEIGVVDARPKMVNLLATATAKFTASVSAAGNGPLTFAWQKNGAPAGQTVKSFTIPATVAAAGLYTCTVTGSAGVFVGGAPTQLNVSDAVPTLVTPLALPAATIGQSYFYKLPVTANAGAPATSFSLVGAPPAGITFNKTTGVLSGRPTVTKSGGYPLTFKAINAKGPGPAASATLTVNAIPSTIVGTFAGVIERSFFLNGNLGGRFDLTTTATGTFSGGITLGSRAKIPFTARLLQSSGAGDIILYGSIPGVTTAEKFPMTAYIEVFAVEQLARLTLIHPNGTTLVIPAWRNPWLLSKTPALNNPATAYATYYTLRLAPELLLNTPAGDGYSSFTVSTAGALTLAGKLPDGSAVTGSTFVGAHGEILLFNLLYATNNRGSHLGKFTVTPAVQLANNTVNGASTWSKPGPLSATSTDTVYKNGFGPINVTAAGSTYPVPAVGALVMGLPATPENQENAQLSFTGGGLAPPLFIQKMRVSLSFAKQPKDAVSLMGTLPPLENSTKLNAFSAKAGSFGGTFTIAGATAAQNRVAPYAGQIVRIGGLTQGYGYFLLPAIPITPENVKTSPKLSGRVVLEAP